jgi:lipoprotein-anchoring transpeptidase ErfK/SrfK
MSRFSILVFSSACAIGSWGCAYASQPFASAAVPQRSASENRTRIYVPFVRITDVRTHVPASQIELPVRLERTLAALRASQYNLRGKTRLRLVVSLEDRVLSALAGKDTVFQAPVGVATGLRLAFAGRAWRFHTPRGTRRVLRKTEDPVWTPPDWHYAETAYNHGLRLARLPAQGVKLSTGAKLAVRDRVVGIIYPGRPFAMLPIDEHIVFDGRVFIPPVGTMNRRITESLGDYALDLGGGYLIHGTTNEASIGQASSHGCIRMRAEDVEWLFGNVPVGTSVVIH